MDNNYLEHFNTYGKAATESAKALEAINTKIIGQLTQKNMELFNAAMEINKKFVSLLGNTKDVSSLLAEQAQLASEYTGKVVETIRDASEIVVGSSDEYQAWFEDSLKGAADFGRAATSTLSKNAA